MGRREFNRLNQKRKQKVISDKMAEIVYTIPLREAFEAPRSRRANKAIKVVKNFLLRHTKAKDVKLDSSVNESLWDRGIRKPPRRIKVRVKKEEDTVTAALVR